MDNSDTMKQVYLLAQEHCGLKVGDWVRIIRGAGDYEGGWPCAWNIYQTNHIGDIGKIVNIGMWGCSINFEDDNSGLIFPYFVLEKAEKPAHKFKPFDKVLVRDSSRETWRCNLFSHWVGGDYPYYCIKNPYKYCISYEGNEHLVGTTDKPEE